MYTGPPSPPDPQLHMLDTATIELFWQPPFTWEDYSIVNYSIQVRNRTTGEAMMILTINTTSTSITFNFSTLHGEVMQICEELAFTVNAASNIGQSEPGVVYGGFPIGNMCTNLLTSLVYCPMKYQKTI